MRHSFIVDFESSVGQQDLLPAIVSRMRPLAVEGSLAVSSWRWLAGDASARHGELQDVRDFQEKFGVPMPDSPAFLNAAAYRFRSIFMEEELVEFRRAHELRDMKGCFDALIDLVYVALGTAHMMGLGAPWPYGWSEVQRKNMLKERAAKDGSDSKRGSSLDVVKPPGWTPPDHTAFVGMGPWPTFVPDGASGDEAAFAPRSHDLLGGWQRQEDAVVRTFPAGVGSFEAADRALASLPQDGPPPARLEARPQVTPLYGSSDDAGSACAGGCDVAGSGGD